MYKMRLYADDILMYLQDPSKSPIKDISYEITQLLSIILWIIKLLINQTQQCFHLIDITGIKTIPFPIPISTGNIDTHISHKLLDLFYLSFSPPDKSN